MNKSDLVREMSSTTGFNLKTSTLALEAFVTCVQTALTSGDSVKLVGFGTFEARQRAERNGRNPQTGLAITIPAKKAPVFKASKNFKEIVAN